MQTTYNTLKFDDGCFRNGVATLVEAMQTARKCGYQLILCRMDVRVRSIFEIAKLDAVFNIVGSLDEALKA